MFYPSPDSPHLIHFQDGDEIMDLDDVGTGEVILWPGGCTKEAYSLNSPLPLSLSTPHSTPDDSNNGVENATPNLDSMPTADSAGDCDTHPELASLSCHSTRPISHPPLSSDRGHRRRGDQKHWSLGENVE